MERNYDYSKAEYYGNNKICVICHKQDKYGNEHGEFWMTPSNLRYGYGCPKCKKEKLSRLKSYTTEVFIEKAKKVHGDKYDYSKVIYKGSNQKICIICPTHGEFWQIATQHLKGCGCPKCAGIIKSSTEEFIEKARKIHDNRYDYSKVEYKNVNTKVCIICPIHGEFWQTPKNHLNGQGCNKCAIDYKANKRKLSLKEFIEKARKIHGNKYDYSKVEYKGIKEKVIIICPIHGEFWQTPNGHLSGCGCAKCSNGGQKLTTKDFVKRAKLLHGDKYDYSKVEYKGMHIKVCIICPIHGEFWQTPSCHLKTGGCEKCGIEKRTTLRTMSKADFIRKAIEIHGSKYDYSKLVYKGSDKKVCIICPIHGEFWQIANDHLRGSHCPSCSVRMSKPENDIFQYMKQIIPDANIIQRDTKLLNRKEIDIYIPDKKLAIEYDGLAWHNTKYNKNKNYHLYKTNECKKQGIQLIHIFEDEWLEKENIVKSMLNNIIGNNISNIPVEKCKIQTVDEKIAMHFLEENHIQGKCSAKYYYGLYNNNELITVAAFNKIRRTNKYNDSSNNTWKLVRFCNKINTIIVGAENVLLKKFIKEIHPSRIISYADKRWSNGDFNRNLGFTYIDDTEPEYYYVVGSHRENKSKYNKASLIKQGYDISKTEFQIMTERGIHRIYDCGTMVFQLDLINNNN